LQHYHIKVDGTVFFIMSTSQSSPTQSGGGQGRGSLSKGECGTTRGPQQEAPSKFKGHFAELSGHIFDCSDSKQADKFVHTLKRISEYVGLEYKHGGDIHSLIINEAQATVPLPTPPPAPVDPAVTTPAGDDLQRRGRHLHQTK
jgi:hypothetical protein